MSGFEHPLQTTVEVGAEFLVRRVRGRGEGPDHQGAAGRQLGETVAAEVTQPTLHPVPDHGDPDAPADHEADPGRALGPCRDSREQMHHEGVAPAAAAGA